MILADLRVHSKFSDGELTLPEVIDFYGERDFDCIAITDLSVFGKLRSVLQPWKRSLNDATVLLYKEILKTEIVRAWDKFGMLVIPGLEMSYGVSAIGIDRFSLSLSAADFVRDIRSQNGLLAALPHMSHALNSFEPEISLRSRGFRKGLDIDGTKTLIDSKKDFASVMKALRAGDFSHRFYTEAHGGESLLITRNLSHSRTGNLGTDSRL